MIRDTHPSGAYRDEVDEYEGLRLERLRGMRLFLSRSLERDESELEYERASESESSLSSLE